MSRTMSLLGGLLCLTASVGVALGGWLRPTPATPAVEELLVTPAVHDFGVVGQAEILAAEFTVTNRYRQPVHIVELANSCSCVQLTADSHDLAPGASTTVHVGWRTHGKRGKVSDTLGIVYLAGSEAAVKTYHVHADVAPDVTLTLDRVTFDEGQPAEQTLTLTYRDPNSAARVVTAFCTTDAVTPLIAPDGRCVTLRYDPAQPVTQGAHQLLLKLTATTQQWLEVTLVFERMGAPHTRSSP